MIVNSKGAVEGFSFHSVFCCNESHPELFLIKLITDSYIVW